MRVYSQRRRCVTCNVSFKSRASEKSIPVAIHKFHSLVNSRRVPLQKLIRLPKKPDLHLGENV